MKQEYKVETIGAINIDRAIKAIQKIYEARWDCEVEVTLKEVKRNVEDISNASHAI